MIEQQHKVDLYERERAIEGEMLILNELISRVNLLQIHTRLKAQDTINKLDSQCVKITEKLHHYRKELSAIQYELEQIRLQEEMEQEPRPAKPLPEPGTMKCCSRCQKSYLANKEYFYGDSKNSDGLRHTCKVCYHKLPGTKIPRIARPNLIN